MKRDRSRASWQRVKTSSNWSTTTQLSGSSGAGVSRCPYVVAGVAPGVRMRSLAGQSPAAISSRSRAISPARSRDDLPLPEGPNSTANRWSRTSASTSATTWSRPKKRCRSAGSNRASPRYGAAWPSSGSAAETRLASASASFQRGPHSAGSPSQARTYPSSTASVGSRSPAAACDSVVAEKPAAFAIVRYEGPPAARRSSRNSCASPCTAPARGSTGRSGRPMRVPPYTSRKRHQER
jgi:hypothetical protein